MKGVKMPKVIMENGVDVTDREFKRLVKKAYDAFKHLREASETMPPEILDTFYKERDAAFKEAGELLGVGE